jgi:hypothetical protein
MRLAATGTHRDVLEDMDLWEKKALSPNPSAQIVSKRSFCIFSGLSVFLIVSFAINNGPPPSLESCGENSLRDKRRAGQVQPTELSKHTPGSLVTSGWTSSYRASCFCSCSLGESDAAPCGLDDLGRSHNPHDGESRGDHFLH